MERDDYHYFSLKHGTSPVQHHPASQWLSRRWAHNPAFRCVGVCLLFLLMNWHSCGVYTSPLRPCLHLLMNRTRGAGEPQGIPEDDDAMTTTYTMDNYKREQGNKSLGGTKWKRMSSLLLLVVEDEVDDGCWWGQWRWYPGWLWWLNNLTNNIICGSDKLVSFQRRRRRTRDVPATDRRQLLIPILRPISAHPPAKDSRVGGAEQSKVHSKGNNQNERPN